MALESGDYRTVERRTARCLAPRSTPERYENAHQPHREPRLTVVHPQRPNSSSLRQFLAGCGEGYRFFDVMNYPRDK